MTFGAQSVLLKARGKKKGRHTVRKKSIEKGILSAADNIITYNASVVSFGNKTVTVEMEHVETHKRDHGDLLTVPDYGTVPFRDHIFSLTG